MTPQRGALLTTAEAANLLGIAPATLSIWRSTGRGRVPFVRVGRLVRYRIDDIDEFILSQRVTAGVNNANASQGGQHE